MNRIVSGPGRPNESFKNRLLTGESDGAINPLGDVGLHDVESGLKKVRTGANEAHESVDIVQKSRLMLPARNE